MIARLVAALLDLSLRHRAAVVIAWIGIAAVGTASAIALPLDAFPDTTPVQVQVNSVADGLSPVEIERLVTVPLEASISGLPNLAEVRSVSKPGFAQITATFEDGTDLYLARQLVLERARSVELPAEVPPPQLGPIATGLGEVFHYLVHGDRPLAELRTIQDWTIRPQLRSVPGVAEVNSWGGDERQVHVLVDPIALQRFDLSLDELAHAIEANSANVGGGTLDRAGEGLLVRGIGLATSVSDVSAIVVATREGTPIRVSDVAEVVMGRAQRRGAATADGRGEVVLGLGFVLVGENSRDVTQRLRLRLDEITRTLPAGVEVTPVYERTSLVERVLATVEKNLLEGAILVILVLFAFLRDVRAGLVVALTIPLSMLFAANLMWVVGVTGSLMSLGAIDFGLLVDAAVIQVENVTRRLAEAPTANRVEVVRDAIAEVRGPTLFGELIIAIVYLPILTLEGIEGRLFRPMALTVLFALAGSMLLSLTLVPALAGTVLRASPGSHSTGADSWMGRAYRRVLGLGLSWPRAVLVLAAALVALAAFVGANLGSEFVPRLREGALVLNTVRLAGVSVDESVRYGDHVERVLMARFPDEIDHVWTRTGSAEITTDPMGVELSDVFVTLTPREEWTQASTQDELSRAMAEELEGMPGMNTVMTQPIEMRVNEMVAGIRADVGVIVFGDDYDVLRTQARLVEAAVESVPGAVDVSTEQLTGQPTLEVEIDRAGIARHGIAAADVLAAVQAIGGTVVGTMQDGERRIPIAVRFEEDARVSPEAVGRVLVAGQTGDRVPLERIARIRVAESPATIQRTWGRRRIVVQANVEGRDLGGFVADVERAVSERAPMPDGYYVRYGGQFEHLERAERRLLVVVPVALLLVFGLLYATYGRVRDAARVFTGVPFAAVGGVLALWLRDMPFSVPAAVGFVALSGVSVLGDMVLVSAIRRELAEGRTTEEAILAAATGRLRPVLMTALVASLGFVPMALSDGFGAEVQRPLATVVVGGVLSSTLLTLVVLPVLYRVTGGASRPRGAPEETLASTPERRSGQRH